MVSIPGAFVRLSTGKGDRTNEVGAATFTGVPFGEHRVTVTATDPANPILGESREATGTLVLSADSPDETITIILVWQEALADTPPPAAPGVIKGRICAPRPPGAEVQAVGPDGKTASAFVSADGILGVWRSFTLPELVPGLWTLTLKTSEGGAISQKLTVTPGTTVQAADFMLACTGQPGSGSPWPYISGGLLILTGALLHWRGRKPLSRRAAA